MMKVELMQTSKVDESSFLEQRFYTELGFAIRSYRRSKNFSQDYMALKLNISQTAYSKIEAGKSGFSAYRLMGILNLLGVEPNIILTSFYISDQRH